LELCVHYESYKTITCSLVPDSTPQISIYLPQKTTKEDKAEITKILAEFCIENGCSFNFTTFLAMKKLIIKTNNSGYLCNLYK